MITDQNAPTRDALPAKCAGSARFDAAHNHASPHALPRTHNRPVGEPQPRRPSASYTGPSRRRDRPLLVPQTDALRPVIMRCSIWAEVAHRLRAGDRTTERATCVDRSAIVCRLWAALGRPWPREYRAPGRSSQLQPRRAISDRTVSMSSLRSATDCSWLAVLHFRPRCRC